MINPRKIAVKALIKIEIDKSFSNLTLNSLFKDIDISREDKSFVTALVYGVLERKITIDYVLKRFIKTPLNKVSILTLTALRIAVYQILFMEKIPDSAAVNESVKIIKQSKDNKNSGFVNAVLRNILRDENLLPTNNNVENMSVIYSCPVEIINSFINDYGIDEARKILEESLKKAPLTIKVNTLKINVDEFENQLNVECLKTDLNDALILSHGFDISGNELFKNGMFYVQDLASQKTVSILNPAPNSRLLDMCSAPGGKSFSAAILMQNKGEVVSCDLYEHKCNLINATAKKLGLDIINPKVCDGTIYNDKLGEFDYILCDVPCSGLGIIRRKPEIKYKNFADFDDLCDIQYKILQNAKNYLKQSGKILYSTCTLRKAENENIVEKFLNENPNFELEYSHTFMPHKDNTDGFFVSLLTKKV